MTTTTVGPMVVFPVFEHDRVVADVGPVAAYLAEVAEREAVDAYLAAVHAQQQARTPAPVAVSGACAIPANICHRESRGDPYAVNPTGCSGRSCYGKYQFDPRTWDSTVRRMGRDDLVGVYLPDEGTQDLVAAFLWDGGRGCSHWAAC